MICFAASHRIFFSSLIELVYRRLENSLNCLRWRSTMTNRSSPLEDVDNEDEDEPENDGEAEEEPEDLEL